jgi:hypothetical protein
MGTDEYDRLKDRPGPSAAVRSTANRLRSAYVARRRAIQTQQTGRPSTWGETRIPRWDGGLDPNGVRHPCIWLSIARRCLEDGLDPFVLVALLFEGREVGEMPLPNVMLSPRMLDQYEDRAREMEGELKVALRVQNELMVGEAALLAAREKIDRGVALARVLADTTFDLSGLFRYCHAMQAGDPELSQRFLGPALTQYLFRRAIYDRAWGDLIPRTLKTQAEAILAGL